MQRRLSPLPLWLLCIAVGLAVGVVTLLAFTLRRDSVAVDANDRAVESALLPDNWSTYTADVWSIGYPNDWEIEGRPTEWEFHPSVIQELGTYMFVRKLTRTLTQIEATKVGQSDVTRSEFLFAGYPTVKFSVNGGDEYYISYNDDLYLILTDHPTMNEVGIMLATFRFE